MNITISSTSVPKSPPALIDAFKEVPSSVISDNLDRLAGAVGLRPFHRSGRMVGTAFTVRTRPGDNLAIHKALELVGPGDVIVIDGGGDVSRALVGPGTLNEPVSIGGSVISPGDIVLGDEDGVVSFSPGIAATLIETVRAQLEREQQTLKAIREGRYQSPYGRS